MAEDIKEQLQLLNYNKVLKDKLKRWRVYSLHLLIINISLIIALTVCIIIDCTRDTNEQQKTEESNTVTELILNDQLIDELKEKDNEIAQLKDRIAFLSFYPASYEEAVEAKVEEEEKEEINNSIDWHENINLFTIGQKVPLPTDIDTNTFRCMDYRKITDTKSWQYKIQTNSYTNYANGLRYYSYNGEKYYTVALATAYGIDLGNAYKVTLANGTVFNIIHAAYKHDIRYPSSTDFGDNDVNYDNEPTISVIEFVYDWVSAPKQLISDGEANRYLGEGCDIYGDGCNIVSMEYLGKIWNPT